MSLIEYWTMSECPDCGVLTCATAEQVQWCDEHCRSDMTAVEVVRADAYRGAVSETERLRHEVQARDDVIYHAAEHLRRALDAIAAYEDRITDVGGQ
jgi:hypothetical protein